MIPGKSRHRSLSLLDSTEKLVLVGLLSLLAYRLVPLLAETPVIVVFLAAETMVVLMAAFRRPTNQISSRPADWLLGFAGTFLPLLVAPAGGGLVVPGGALMVVGFGVAVSAQVTLRRSFGIVAANRGLKTAGVYSVVRHPMYTGYLLTNTGFLLANPNVWNASIYFAWIVCQVYRVHAEERVLSSDAGYGAFTQRVRYRVLPPIY